MCEATIGSNMAGRHLCDRTVTVVDDHIGGPNSNEVNECNSLGNTALIQVNQGAETEGTVVISE